MCAAHNRIVAGGSPPRTSYVVKLRANLSGRQAAPICIVYCLPPTSRLTSVQLNFESATSSQLMFQTVHHPSALLDLAKRIGLKSDRVVKFTNEGNGPTYLGLAAPFPGKVIPVHLQTSGTLLAKPSMFLARSVLRKQAFVQRLLPGVWEVLEAESVLARVGTCQVICSALLACPRFIRRHS